MAQLRANSRLLHPDFLSNTDLYEFARVDREQFQVMGSKLCRTKIATQTVVNQTADATRANCKLPHDARVLLYRYRLVHGATFTVLGSLFMCGRQAARKAFWDIGMKLLMCDPQVGGAR